MIAFNQITKILDIEALAPEDKPLNIAQARKRPFNSTDEEGMHWLLPAILTHAMVSWAKMTEKVGFS